MRKYTKTETFIAGTMPRASSPSSPLERSPKLEPTLQYLIMSKTDTWVFDDSNDFIRAVKAIAFRNVNSGVLINAVEFGNIHFMVDTEAVDNYLR